MLTILRRKLAPFCLRFWGFFFFSCFWRILDQNSWSCCNSIQCNKPYGLLKLMNGISSVRDWNKLSWSAVFAYHCIPVYQTVTWLRSKNLIPSCFLGWNEFTALVGRKAATEASVLSQTEQGDPFWIGSAPTEPGSLAFWGWLGFDALV